MHPTSWHREKYTVVIIGAGAAGIGAARELKAQGIGSVLILEGTKNLVIVHIF